MNPLLILIAFFTFLIPLLVGNKLGVVRYFSPLHITAYLIFFGVLLKTVWFYFFDGILFFEHYLRDDRYAYQGYLYILGFVVLVCVGYALVSPRKLQLSSIEERRQAVLEIRYVKGLVIAAFGIAAIVIEYLLSARGLGGLDTAFSIEAIDGLNSTKIQRIEGQDEFGASDSAIKTILVIPTLALLVLLLKQQVSGKLALPLAALLLLEFYIVLTQGSRFALVITLMTILLATILMGRRFTPRQLGLAVVAGVVAMALFVAMTTFRMGRGPSAETEFEIRPAIEQVVGSTYFLDVNSPILIIALSDERDRFWGASYTFWTYAWIPRAFWPEKPVVTLGPYVKREILGIEGSIGGVNPTGPGEAFINFGWFGLLVGLFVGALYRGLEIFTLSAKGVRKRAGLWLYPIVVVPFIVATLQSSFSGALVSAAVKAGLVFATIFLLTRKPHKKRRRYSREERYHFHARGVNT